MPIKPKPLSLQLEKNAIMRVLKYTGDVYEKGEAPEIILSKLEMAKDSEVFKDVEPLIFMLEQTFRNCLNCTWIDYTEYLTTIYIDFEDYKDFAEISERMKADKSRQQSCSVEYFLTETIWFPYEIDIEDNENFMSIQGKILNLDLGADTRKFYKYMIPRTIPDVELVKAEIKDNYLSLTIKSKDPKALQYYEELITKRYAKIVDGRLVD